MNILKKVFLGFIFVFGTVNLNASSSSDTDDCVDFKENPYRGRAKIVAKLTLFLSEKQFCGLCVKVFQKIKVVNEVMNSKGFKSLEKFIDLITDDLPIKDSLKEKVIDWWVKINDSSYEKGLKELERMYDLGVPDESIMEYGAPSMNLAAFGCNII